jgi:PST family polysaccharide transporter
MPSKTSSVSGSLPARAVSILNRFRIHLANLTAFTLLQAASYLIPVVTIPYFARVLGIFGMGLLAITGAIGLAAGVLMDYAVQLSGTRFAASHVDDPSAIKSYLDATLAVKLAILLPIALAMAVSSFVFDQVAAHFWVFCWALASAATVCLFPQWLFQGLLAMPLAARILVVCRVGAAAMALALVRTPDDVFIVPMTQAIGGSVALSAAVFTLRRRVGITPGLPAWRRIGDLLRQNWKLFSATAWGATYTHGGVIIMSTMLPTSSIGYYSIAQKISQAFVSMFNVAAQTFFPSFVRMHKRAAGSFGLQVRVYMLVIVAAAAAALAIMFALRYPLYGFFAGTHSEMGVTIFSIWLVVSLFTIVSVSLNPIMVVLRLDAQMASVYRGVGLIFLIAAPVACAYFGVLGMATATLVTEAVITLFFALGVFAGLPRPNNEIAK